MFFFFLPRSVVCEAAAVAAAPPKPKADPAAAPKPCKTCTGTSTAFDQFKAAGALATGQASQTMAARFGCPENKDTLGRAGWSLLHTHAATYPDAPDEDTQQAMTQYLHLFARFYPCEFCAKHLRDYMVKVPPNTSSRVALSQWMCKMHNDVNRRLGKPAFDCSRVDERWADGWSDGSCDEPPAPA